MNTRVAIVTGARQGIGQAIAIELARRGMRIALVDLKPSDETMAVIGKGVLDIVADVSTDEGWQEIGRRVDEHFGRADIVVNNALFFARGAIDELDVEGWRRSFAVNLDAQFHSARHIAPRMRDNRWGRFIAISSNSIGTAEIGLSAYMATKMGAIGFMRGLANDLGGDGITCNAILPSLTETPQTASLPEEARRAVWSLQAIKRMAQPQDVTGAVAFLASDDASFITGQALVVDGGLYKIS
ncbi:(S)-1-Phenylethanol dehydrogenase [Burkholderia cenocepacia]|uniref:(S)-1-Phenylethanol dehydrogenase n=1 Tax=Burkholderia cenocepacia TaxID=95486 RepID=A0AAN0VQD5_9BURK|nr:(S)-1-Phenylethanol dehydrogenase [Burkholderia cenocepacia]